MNLVEALREIGPVSGGAATAAVRIRAAELIHQELQHLAAHSWLRIGEADRQDAAARVVLRLINNGPRGERVGDPTTSGGVQAFLRTAFGNAVRDLLRRQKRWVEMAEGFDVADLRRGPSEEASRREEASHMRAVEEALFGKVLPELARSSRNGSALLDAFDTLRAVRDGRTTIAELVRSECDEDPDPRAEKRGRNRLDQRFSRAFARLHGEIEARRADGRLGEESAGRMRQILDGLRLRQ